MSMKQSPVGIRTKSSKGFKVKHVMQICLLLVISIWLIYQMKHSYDKKAAAAAALTGHGLPSEDAEQERMLSRIGRKDLRHPIATSRSEVTGESRRTGNTGKGEMDEQVKSDDIEGRVGGGDEGDRTEEEEPEEAEDLIDVEDRDTGKPNIDNENGSSGNEDDDADELKSSI
ncbi:hypothetical protein LINGRAHAP2_LOCUS32861 [Linum grandiflorum]